MLIFKSYCIILLFDDKVNYKSKYHDCKIDKESKVYNKLLSSLLLEERQRKIENVWREKTYEREGQDGKK